MKIQNILFEHLFKKKNKSNYLSVWKVNLSSAKHFYAIAIETPSETVTFGTISAFVTIVTDITSCEKKMKNTTDKHESPLGQKK